MFLQKLNLISLNFFLSDKALKDRKDYVKDTDSVCYETDEVPISTHKSLTDTHNERLFFHKLPRNFQKIYNASVSGKRY